MKSSLVVSVLHFYRALWDLTNLKSAAMHWQIPIVWTINDWKPKLRGGPKGPKASVFAIQSELATPPASTTARPAETQQVHTMWRSSLWMLLRHMKDLFRRHKARKLTSYPCKWACESIAIAIDLYMEKCFQKSPGCNYHSSTIRQKPLRGWIAMA